MKGDFTRDTFDATKHYQQVLMQQGRAQIDADWNEQSAVMLRRDETTTDDVVGDAGGPADHAAFGVVLTSAEAKALGLTVDAARLDSLKPVDFVLTPGRYYVDGIQCELEGPRFYRDQPDHPAPEPIDAPTGPVSPIREIGYVAYLDVWQRHLTAVEDPGIRETALGGPDTATRVKTVWQVRTTPMSNTVIGPRPGPAPRPVDTEAVLAWIRLMRMLLADRRALLTADTNPAQNQDGVCSVPSGAGFTGLENQLYRLEIHWPGEKPGKSAFITKWSRNNGAMVAGVLGMELGSDGTTCHVKVTNLGPDALIGFHAQGYAELFDDQTELEAPSTPKLQSPSNRVLSLVRIVEIDRDNNEVILESVPKSLGGTGTAPEILNLNGGARLRQWDGTFPVTPKAAPDERWFALESGIRVQFDADSAYVAGDHWLIPARTATAEAISGDIEWPRTDPKDPTSARKPLPSRGPLHHFAPLAYIQWAPREGEGGQFIAHDLRSLFSPLRNVPRLFHVGGDGQEVMPDMLKKADPVRLPEPLQVGLANAVTLDPLPKVRFRVVGDSPGYVGDLLGGTPTSATEVDVSVDLQGVASCVFSLKLPSGDPTGANLPDWRVVAHLLDEAGREVSVPIYFNAQLSVAAQVAFDPSQSPPLKDIANVQDALERIVVLPWLEAVGGDGQSGIATHVLASPIEVRVNSMNGPVAGAKVTFKADAGSGLVGAAPATCTAAELPDVLTDAQGVARAYWQLGVGGPPDFTHGELPGGNRPEQRLVARISGLPASLAFACDPDPLRLVAFLVREPRCWTVGPAGDFATLDEALEVVPKKTPDVCLRLLPGDHQPANLRLIAPAEAPMHLRLTGCGRGSRVILKKTALFRGLSSVSLRDLGIYSDVPFESDGPVIGIEACTDVLVENCHLGGLVDQAAVLAVRDAMQVAIANNEVEAATVDSFKPMLEFFGQVPSSSLAEVFQPTPWPKFDRMAREAGARIAGLAADARQKILAELQAAGSNDAVKKNASVGELSALETFATALITTPDAVSLGDALRSLRSAAVRARPGVAIVLDETAGLAGRKESALLEDNLIAGVLVPSGRPPGNPLTPEEVAAFVKTLTTQTPPQVTARFGPLTVRGNRLVRLALGSLIVDQIRAIIKSGKGGVVSPFGPCVIAENTFDGGVNAIVGRQLSMSGNKFTFSAAPIDPLEIRNVPVKLAGTSLSDAAVFIGNQAERANVVWADLSRGSDKAANLAITIQSAPR